VVAAATSAFAQRDLSQVQIKTEKLASNVWALQGAGGNVALCAGPDGALLVDDQYDQLSEKILEAVKQASGQPLRWVVNTHWHGDHTGGNEKMAQAGALVMAHDRVRIRMVEGLESQRWKRTTPPAAPKALPLVTFNDSTTLHVNGETIVVFHVAPAHTDGDAIVVFTKANVVHMGDTFFNGFYPIIDTESGGRSAGMIAAAERVLARIDAQTNLIPGHGPVTSRTALERYRDMLKGTRGAVAKLVKQKKTLEEVQAAKPTAPWDEQWGKGSVKPELYVEMLYSDLAR
jgi:glyoxylase-like metal-dependent hydrolase (beta-lactamase superfamily II)